MHACTVDEAGTAAGSGHRQPAVAQEALQAIFANKQRFYSITLSDVLPNGQMRHTAYKAVPAAVCADTAQQASCYIFSSV